MCDLPCAQHLVHSYMLSEQPVFFSSALALTLISACLPAVPGSWHSFWTQASARDPWVQKEWQSAVAAMQHDYIELLHLDPDEPLPPALKSLYLTPPSNTASCRVQATVREADLELGRELGSGNFGTVCAQPLCVLVRLCHASGTRWCPRSTRLSGASGPRPSWSWSSASAGARR
jgi:hypothetical protein